MNIIGAYMESFLKQNKYSVYMRILQKCRIGWKDLVYRIIKSLYGLK